MCGPDDRNRFGRRPRMHGEPVKDYTGNGRAYGPTRYESDDRGPEPDWRYERRGECCCRDEEDGPAVLAGLAEQLDGMVDEVMGDLVREKIMCALEERLGDKLDRMVEAVVDSHIEDLEDLLRGCRSRRPDLIEKFARIILEDYENGGEEDCCECCCDGVEDDEKKKDPE